MADELINRKLPFSMEAEQSVLGSILIDPECFSEIAGILHKEDFYVPQNGQIFDCMNEMFVKNQVIDAVTLLNLLTQGGGQDEAEAANYMKLIVESVPSARNVKDYALIVRDKATLRRLIGACDEITETAYTASAPVADIVDAAEQKIFSIAQGNIQQNFTPISEVLVQTYEHLKLLETNPEEVMGIPSGFSALDAVLVGMGKNDLVLIGARPGMGKTSFALNIATKAARSTGKTVCIFSLEMSNEQLVSRMLSSEALVDSHKLRTGKLESDDWTKLAEASSALSECNILIDDTSGIGVTQMKAKLRRVKNLGMVIIDYLQLMQSDRKIDNRVQEVAEISRGLKLLAKELQAPVICCAQLSRGPESRTDKRPMLSDLRDSGAIEQDADIVMFLYRDQYYDRDDPSKQNKASIILAKNRHGSTGEVEMGWLGQFTKFVSLSDQEAPPQ